MAWITGTSAAETLAGTDGDDQIQGLGGGDIINSGAGGDVVEVGEGTDQIDAGDGDDSVYTTGGGDDVIHLGAGDDTVGVAAPVDATPRTVKLHGEAGNDYFLLNDYAGATTFQIDGGDGTDEIRLQTYGQATIDGGAGDDLIFLFEGGATTITLGGGRDTLFLYRQGWYGDTTATILDFQASGPSADRLDVATFLFYGGAGGAVLSANPFATDHLRLVQSGADTLVQARRQMDGQYATAIKLVGVQASALTAASFSGFDPHGSGPPTGIDIVGGADRDVLYGSLFDDDLRGGDGRDRIEGNGGFDILDGQGGNDQLYGRGPNGQTMLGGDGDDDLTFYLQPYFSTGSSHPVRMEGGAGVDYLVFDAIHGGANLVVEATLKGDAGNDVFYISGDVSGVGVEGGEGDDTVHAGKRDDRLDGGTGVDTLSYYIVGGGVTVDLALTVAQDTHGAGVDTIAGFENLEGSGFGDDLWGDDRVNRMDGGAGADILHGRGGGDILQGGDGDDELHGDAGIDQLSGGAGGDLFDGGTGGEAFRLDGVGGDVASFRYELTKVTVDLSNAGPQNTGFGLDRFVGIEEVWGGLADDDLTGDGLANRLLGYESDDRLNGGGGDDVLDGGAGDDRLDGGSGLDVAFYGDSTSRMTVDLTAGTAHDEYGYYSPSSGQGVDTLVSIEGVVGSAYDDSLTGQGGDNKLLGGGGDDLLHGLAGDDLLDGGAGSDTADYAEVAGSVTIDLNIATAQDTGAGRDILVGVENLVGSAQDDLLTGDGAANSFTAGSGQDWLVTNGGADLLKGGDGHDSLWGGAGDDGMEGGAGDDTLFGGEGRDTAVYASATSAVRIDLTLLEEQNTGGGGVDTLISVENITGSDFADVLIGNAGDNVITGGKTTWVGGGLDPTRYRGDVMTGGGGNDTFVFKVKADADATMADRITDFSLGDQIDLSDFDLDIWTPGRQGLHFGETADRKGDITTHYYPESNATGVFITLSDGGQYGAEMVIYVLGEHLNLTASDFIL